MAPAARPKSTPAFLTKLYSMVDTTTEHEISWTPDGLAFIVPRPRKFASESPLQWFNHSKLSSFIRQLNMYDFHKVPSPLEDDESITFKHEHFQRDRPYLLTIISRKKPGSTTVEDSSATTSKRTAARRGPAGRTSSRKRRSAPSSDKRNIPSDAEDPPSQTQSEVARPSPVQLAAPPQVELTLGTPLDTSGKYQGRNRSHSSSSGLFSTPTLPAQFSPVAFSVPLQTFLPTVTSAITRANQASRFDPAQFMPSAEVPKLGEPSQTL